MLSTEAIKRLISNKDRFVRELAVDHFTKGRLSDPDVPHLMLAAAGTYGDAKLLVDLEKLPLDTAALAAVVERAAEGRKGEYRHLVDAILWAPISSQIANRGLIASALADDKELVERVEERCGLAERTPEELWGLLNRPCRVGEDDVLPELGPPMIWSRGSGISISFHSTDRTSRSNAFGALRRAWGSGAVGSPMCRSRKRWMSETMRAWLSGLPAFCFSTRALRPAV